MSEEQEFLQRVYDLYKAAALIVNSPATSDGYLDALDSLDVAVAAFEVSMAVHNSVSQEKH